MEYVVDGSTFWLQIENKGFDSSIFLYNNIYVIYLIININIGKSRTYETYKQKYKFYNLTENKCKKIIFYSEHYPYM